MFAKTQMSGLSIGFPDVCLTPAPSGVAPIPYPNLSMSMLAVPNVLNILKVGMPAHNMGTVTPMTMGDTPGVSLGVASGLVMGPQSNLTGAFTALVGGLPCTRMTSVSLGNLSNAPGATLVPSQVKILILAP